MTGDAGRVERLEPRGLVPARQGSARQRRYGATEAGRRGRPPDPSAPGNRAPGSVRRAADAISERRAVWRDAEPEPDPGV